MRFVVMWIEQVCVCVCEEEGFGKMLDLIYSFVSLERIGTKQEDI